MNDPLYIAVDLGAGGGRVFLAGMEPGDFLLEEVRRFCYPPSESGGHLRWDISKVFEEIKLGARQAGQRARVLKQPVQSMGVDSWGVDYGLIDKDGKLIEHPICYRDQRTESVMDQVFARLPRAEIFARTGIQFLAFNTLFQFYAHVQAGVPDAATQLLLIPDLINFFLTGRAISEFTNASTTQMVNAESGTWDREMLQRLGLPVNLLAEIVPARAELGQLSPPIAAELGLDGVRVVAPATHDTGSAVVGAPLEAGWAYISSGTWSLVGVERDSVLINRDVAKHNFTNEGGVFGTIRFLKNVMGLWILESCRKEWTARGMNVDYDKLLSQIERRSDFSGFIFPDDPRFFNPPSMLDAIARQLRETDQCAPNDPVSLARVILDSLAFRYASLLRTIEALTKQEIKGVHIIGGGSRNDYLNQAAADATGLPVVAGPVEATVIGNVLIQAIAAGRFASLSDARQYVKQNSRLKSFAPQPAADCEEAGRRYAEIEARCLE